MGAVRLGEPVSGAQAFKWEECLDRCHVSNAAAQRPLPCNPPHTHSNHFYSVAMAHPPPAGFRVPAPVNTHVRLGRQRQGPAPQLHRRSAGRSRAEEKMKQGAQACWASSRARGQQGRWYCTLKAEGIDQRSGIDDALCRYVLLLPSVCQSLWVESCNSFLNHRMTRSRSGHLCPTDVPGVTAPLQGCYQRY